MYRYYKEENVIKEVAWTLKNYVGNPDNEYAIKLYLKDLKEIEKHNASLKSFPCQESCKALWNDGKEVSEGVDYEITIGVTNINDKSKMFDVVYPLTKPETEDEDLRHEIRLMYDKYKDSSFVNFIDELFKRYSIKRITADEVLKDRTH